MNNIAEQFEELYSRWTLLDKAGKNSHLADMMNKTQGLYKYLVMAYGNKGYLTADEYKQVEDIRQFHQYLQSQKMKVYQDLADEMLKHLVKMKAKQI